MSDKCGEAVEHLYSYLDQELTWWRRRQIRRHIESCPPCSRCFSFEERLQVVVRGCLSEQVPAEFIVRLQQVITEERPS